MFGKLKEKFGFGAAATIIVAPVEGEALPLSEVSDPTFGEGILGKGAAIRPKKGRVVSPVSGTVDTIFDTGHAVSLHSDEGVDILIHVGLDTVKLKGRGYKKHVENGQRVSPGDLLIEFDVDVITGEGYDIITPVIICNSDDFVEIEREASTQVSELAPLLRLKRA